MCEPSGAMQSNLVRWVSDLARDHARALGGVAASEGLAQADALDAVQEAFHTFLGLPQARGLAGEREDALRLMTVLVRNAARNMRRRHHRSRPHDAVDEVEIAADDPPAEDQISQAEEHIALLGCVSQLGEIQRRVVTLRMIEELSGDDTARALALRPDHVAVLLYRAKNSLRICLDP